MEGAEILRSARAAAGLTQRRLAVRSGIPQSAIARIERGGVVPRLDTLQRLLAGCGRTLESTPLRVGDVDRSLIREFLKLTPDERIRYASESSRNVAALMSEMKAT